MFVLISNLVFSLVVLIKHARCDCSASNETHFSKLCDKFESWTDLNKLINTTNRTLLFKTNDPGLNVHPASPIMLTSELDIANLANYFNATNLLSTSGGYNVILSVIGINGIDLTQWPALSLPVAIRFTNSYIEFCVNRSSLAGFKCSNELISVMQATLFNIFNSVEFLFQNNYASGQLICLYSKTHS
jgi:hypothetical protein